MIRRPASLLRVALAFLTLLPSLGLWAQSAQAAPLAQSAQAPTFTFAELGLSGASLASPIARKQFSFSLPAGQLLAEGASLTLNLRTVIIDTAAVLPEDERADLGGIIQIEFNSQVLETVPLTAEPNRSIRVDIPAEALATPPADGRYTLNIELQTRTNCAYGNAIRVTVRPDSSFTLPTESGSISADLRALPRPLFQRSFLPETAILVVPDAPSAAELRSAMIVAAGLGRMSGNRLGISLRRSSELGEEEQANHLVMVGSAAGLPLLSEVDLPTAVQGGAFADLSADDGIVQAAVSPWDETKLVLVVGGNSETGLLKAAQAFALNRLLLDADQPDSSLIADVNMEAEEELPTERSITDLGYPNPRRVTDFGTSSIYYYFTLPTGQVAADGAFVEIAFAHTALLNYTQSSLTAVLNGSEIGAARLSDATVDITRTSFLMPSDLLRPGRNEIQLRVNLAPRDGCVNREDLDLWLNVWPDSRINVPLEAANEAPLRSASLKEFPDILTISPTLADMALVVGKDDAASWDVASQLIAGMATQTNESPVDLALVFDGEVTDELRQSHNLVLVGRPSQLALVGELNEQLPAPFENNSDVATNRITRVSFRLAEQEQVGYLQLLSAPWNKQRLVLGVLGNSPEGIAQAGQALTRSDLQSQLGGNFAMIVGEQVISGGSRLALGRAESAATDTTAAGAAQESESAAVTPAVAPAANPPMLLALIASVLVMLLVVGGVVGLNLYRRGRMQP